MRLYNSNNDAFLDLKDRYIKRVLTELDIFCINNITNTDNSGYFYNYKKITKRKLGKGSPQTIKAIFVTSAGKLPPPDTKKIKWYDRVIIDLPLPWLPPTVPNPTIPQLQVLLNKAIVLPPNDAAYAILPNDTRKRKDTMSDRNDNNNNNNAIVLPPNDATNMRKEKDTSVSDGDDNMTHEMILTTPTTISSEVTDFFLSTEARKHFGYKKPKSFEQENENVRDIMRM